MKIRNTTDLDTAAMRSLIRAVVRDVEKTLVRHGHPRAASHPEWADAKRISRRAEFILKSCEVWIRQRRDARASSEYTSGRASLGGGRMTLTIGSPDPVQFLWLVRHEVWHLFRLHHADFPEAVMHRSPAAFDACREIYAKAIARIVNIMGEIPAKPTAVGPVVTAEERAANRLADVAAAEKRWTTKLRRAQTALAKLKRKRRYYERQLATAASRSERSS